MIIINNYKNITPYITQDGSEIRELMHPDSHDNQLQSLAEAIIKPGETTLPHHHIKSEEIYYILQGEGRMQHGDKKLQVKNGDSIYIPPGTQHCIENIGNENLKIICCCSPAYSHSDTVIL